jgi:four helix bundle protein
LKKFEDLEVYKKAFDLSITIYKLTTLKTFDLNIKNQIQRAALSIPLNIAEGFELQSNKQFVRFLYISKGSSGEVRSLLKICEELKILEKDIVNNLILEVEDISKQLSKFISYLKNSEID